MTLMITEAFNLPRPEDIRAMGFVVRLRESDPGSDEVKQLVDDYVITPAVEKELPRILDGMKQVFDRGEEYGRFIHGSFGSGKSHFMTMLSLKRRARLSSMICRGELPKDPLVAETVFRDQDEAKTDKARFNQNAALGSRTRHLFLKGDVADGGQNLLAALSDESIGVVATVFNAVDDQIGSSNTGATVRLTPEDITAFKPALRVALESGRRVLITADHGHSPYIDNSLRMGNGKAPRYLALGPHDAPPDGFIEIDLKGLGGPPERRAFAWRSGAYLGGQQVGFHGGCGLEEVVVPLAWIERGGLHADEPSWWYGRGALAEGSVEVRPIAPPIVTPLPSDELPSRAKAQLSLFNPADKAESLGLPAELLSRLSNDEKSILVLLRDNGHARASDLAERLRRNPGRLNGLMRALRRTLHAEGHVLFSDDVLPSGETLYRYQGKPKPGHGVR